MKKKQIVLWVLLGVVGVAMLAGIISMLVPTRFIDYRVMMTVFVIGSYALGGLIIVAASGRMRRTFRACAGALSISMVIFVGMIWFDGVIYWQWEERIAKTAAVILFIGFTLAHRLLVCPLSASIFVARISKRAALISAVLICTTGSFGLLNDGFGSLDELVMRLMVIFAIVAAGSTFVTGALSIFGPKPGDDEPGVLGSSIQVSMTCPRCQSAVEVRSNKESRCQSCRLKIRVEVEEPRCGCGYLLYELESDVCPECGKAVAADDRWGNGDRG